MNFQVAVTDNEFGNTQISGAIAFTKNYLQNDRFPIFVKTYVFPNRRDKSIANSY